MSAAGPPDGFDAEGAMRAPAPAYVGQLRTRPGTIILGEPGRADRWTVRVQSADAYDAVRVSAPPTEPIVALKVRALQALQPDVDFHEDFVLKLHGAEVRDENASLAESGAMDGSILILVHRRRRPVR
ncbi:MAG TPA: hypothetical protein VEZ47_09055 [Gemmatirosa sp.]|nr:hypothetical protein [Gemmatirosa sp.]